MSNDALDLAFAKHVRTIGLVTQEQVNAAMQAQASRIQQGKAAAFSEILVEMGLLTPNQRETLEKKVKDQQAGVQQLGVYKLLRKLGEGGMGAVYLATDPAGKSVAVKVLPRHLGTNAEFVKRFRRESDAATQLQHPNIIGAFATGEDLGYHYYVMQYCDGQGLDKLLVAKKMLPVAQTLTIGLEVARALKYAHDLGIIHRDIKPSNIMIDRDGQAKILDLGLSKNIGDSALSFKTVTGAVLGTPHYISPEQAQGERSVDGRTDIYSLGATMYHLLTGKTPFDGATALEILSKHVNTVLPNPQDLREEIPDAVVQVLERMMAKEPSDRQRDCGELITDLVEASQGRTPKTGMIAASLTSIAPPQRRVLKKRPHTVRRDPDPQNTKTLLMIGGGVAAAAIVLLALFMSGRPAPPKESTATNTTQSGPKTAVQAPEPARGGFDVATWEKSLAELPPEARVKAVHARLKTLNPGYDSSEAEHHIAHGRVTRLRLAGAALKDVAPVRALTDLRELELPSTGVSDLSPLRNSKLTLLVLDGSKIADLRPLRDMKELAILSLASTPVSDLSPLEGLDLARLTVKGCPSADLSALRRVKLRELHCDFDPKRDTETLKSMPSLEQINGVPVEEFWRKSRPAEPVAVAAPAPMDALGVALAKLKELNPDWDGRETHAMEGGTVVELVIVALGITDLTPLTPLKSLRKLDVSGTWSISEKREYRSKLSDLSPLRGLKLTEFQAHHTDVWDLSPLEGMPIQSLVLTGTVVQNLAPLRKMPLKTLDVSFCRVTDLWPLSGLPLVELRANGNEIADFTAIAGLKLTTLTASLDPVKHHALIDSIKSLARLNDAPVLDFLQVAAPPPPMADAAQWKNALDLIPLIDPARDTVVGPWTKTNGRIYCNGGENAVLRIPWEPPAEYDFRIVYTRNQSHCALAQFLVYEGRNFFYEMGGHGLKVSGFATVGGKNSAENPARSNFVPQDGTRYASLIQVRKDRVTAFLDGRKLTEWVPAMGEITTDYGWCVDVPNLLGLGNCESQTTFESIQVREVTGKGRLRTTALATAPDPSFFKAVAALPPGDQIRRIIDKLKELNPSFDPGTMKYKIENERVTEFSAGSARLFDVWPVKALPALKKLDLNDDRGGSTLAEIGFLKGMKLTELGLSGTRVSDLSPLQGMPLIRLSISRTPVKDLAPLKSMPLQKIDCDRIPADLSVLKSIRTLKLVNDLPAGDLGKPSKDGWTALFDGRSTDCLRRGDGWKVDRGAIQNDPTVINSAQTAFEFENGDLRIRFECRGVDALTFRARQSAQGASGLFFDGASVRALEGKPHELFFSCRGDSVTATLDGKPMPLTESTAVRTGCLQFNATNGVLRVTSIDYRAAN